jgi:large conductance mechanosensitive channel
VRFGLGALLAAILNFLIVGFVAWRLSKLLLPSPTAPATKTCSFCKQADLDIAATRCPHCTSQLA